jgi:hypothetical protein
MAIGKVFAVFGYLVLSAILGTSVAWAQCSAPACGAADCFVDDATGDDTNNCCVSAATPCKTIQEAINQASPGDTIAVAAGTYPESAASPLSVNKTVTLCGAQNGVDARTRGGAESIISNSRGTIVSADNVVVNGFTLEGNTNTNFVYGLDMAQGTTGTQVLNNIVQNNIAGIGLANTGVSTAVICQNLIQNNNNPGSASGTGIYTDQYVCGIAGGYACTNFLIEQNAFKGHTSSGIDISNTDVVPVTNVDVSTNSFDMNGRAVLLFNVDDSTIHNNSITNSTLAASGAIRIFGDVDDLAITSNDLNGGAGWAIRITDGPSTGVVIHENNIANFAGSGGAFGGGLYVGAGAHVGPVDAQCNWWDDPCGPYNVAANPTGPGEEVFEDGSPGAALFIPWLVAPSPAPASGSGPCTGAVCSSSTTTSSTTTTTSTSTTTTTLPDHYQCYEIKPAAYTARTVQTLDQFGSLSLALRYPHRLCAAANKNGEGIQDATEHLTGYPAKSPAPFTKVTNQTVVDQFGTLKLDVVKPDMLMVPTSKDGVPIAAPPADHFACYKVRRTRGAAKFLKRTASVADQFGSVSETLLKPVRLCAPASKNGEDPTAPSHPGHLLCYKTKSAVPFGTIEKDISNQFGDDKVRLIHRRELCVPALKNPPPTTTTTAPTTTSTSAAPTTTTSTTLMGSPSGAFAEGEA